MIKGEIKNSDSFAALIVSPGQPSLDQPKAIIHAADLLAAEPNIKEVVVIYADDLINEELITRCDLKDKTFLTNETARKDEVAKRTKQWCEDHTCTAAVNEFKDDDLFPGTTLEEKLPLPLTESAIAEPKILKLKGTIKSIRVILWSDFIRQHNSLYSEALKKVKALRQPTDTDYSYSLEAEKNKSVLHKALLNNLKYFGKKWFFSKWTTILRSQTAESNMRSRAVEEHAKKEAAFVQTLATATISAKKYKGIYLSHVGVLNPALSAFLDIMKIGNDSVSTKMPFLLYDVPTRKERAYLAKVVQNEIRGDTIESSRGETLSVESDDSRSHETDLGSSSDEANLEELSTDSASSVDSDSSPDNEEKVDLDDPEVDDTMTAKGMSIGTGLDDPVSSFLMSVYREKGAEPAVDVAVKFKIRYEQESAKQRAEASKLTARRKPSPPQSTPSSDSTAQKEHHESKDGKALKNAAHSAGMPGIQDKSPAALSMTSSKSPINVQSTLGQVLAANLPVSPAVPSGLPTQNMVKSAGQFPTSPKVATRNVDSSLPAVTDSPVITHSLSEPTRLTVAS